MSAATDADEGERAQVGLFGDGELPCAEPLGKPSQAAGAPRVMSPQRDQVELRAVDLDALLGPDHPARTVWAFVQALDLAPLYARIQSVAGRGGAPAIDPAILVALWLWATLDGVGSAREVDRLCERDDVYRWICGGVGVNYHSLADFRTAQEAWLDKQLTRSITALLERRLVTLNAVAQDGLRVRAHAKAASFRRRDKLAELHAQASAQVHALKCELGEDAGASTRRKRAATERAARERQERTRRIARRADAGAAPDFLRFVQQHAKKARRVVRRGVVGRTRAATDQYKKAQKLRLAVAEVLKHIPAKLRDTEEVKLLASEADDKICNIVQLIYHTRNYEGISKDFEFSRRTMEEHWEAGYRDAMRAMQHPEVLKRPTREDGVQVFDFYVFPPIIPMDANIPQSREVNVATSLSDIKLEAITQIVVQGANNARSSRR